MYISIPPEVNALLLQHLIKNKGQLPNDFLYSKDEIRKTQKCYEILP